MNDVIECKLFGQDSESLILPDITNINFGKERITKEQRSMNGLMIVDVIAIKDTIELSWNFMKISTLNQIKKIVENYEQIFFDVEITMTESGSSKQHTINKTVFLSDITYVPYFYDNGLIWRDIVIKFTEQ